MKKNVRSFVTFSFLVLLLLSGTVASAQNMDDLATWKTLDEAKALFDNGEFGDALTSCESARKAHVARVASINERLNKYLAPAAIRKAGDSIDAVRLAFENRNEDDAIALVDSILKKRPPAYFSGKVSEMLSWLVRQSAYPEADFLSGRIYEAEGENAIAFSFYEKAWENRGYLDIPDDRFDIAYRMADLARDSGNFSVQEKYLLLILAEDTLFGKPGEETPALRAMIRTLETDRTPDRFFSLYRHDDKTSLKACKDLGSFYLLNHRVDRALPVAALSACIAVTLLSETVAASNFDYEFSSVQDLMNRAGKKAEIAAWARESGIWDSFAVLALALREHGQTEQSAALWSILAQNCPDPAVARRASRELSKSVSSKAG